MAVDEFCAAYAARHRVAILRLYRWRPATLSLGYFQKLEDRERHPPSRACPVVRRPSGGGAILHDREWTYCLALPTQEPRARDRLGLYRAVHQTLVNWLQQWGVQAAILDGTPSQADQSQCSRYLPAVTDARRHAQSPATSSQVAASRTEPGCATAGKGCPFLCFQRRAAGDIVVARHARQSLAKGDSDSALTIGASPSADFATAVAETSVKLVGSAQRRYQDAVLQHGSILLARSAYAPELPGLLDILAEAGKPPPSEAEILAAFCETWPSEFATGLAWELVPWTLPDSEKDQLAELRSKFASDQWTCKRSQ